MGFTECKSFSFRQFSPISIIIYAAIYCNSRIIYCVLLVCRIFLKRKFREQKYPVVYYIKPGGKLYIGIPVFIRQAGVRLKQDRHASFNGSFLRLSCTVCWRTCPKKPLFSSAILYFPDQRLDILIRLWVLQIQSFQRFHNDFQYKIVPEPPVVCGHNIPWRFLCAAM